MEQQVAEIRAKTEAMLAENPAFFLVELRIKPTNNIKVFVDGDQGISIEKLIAFNRKLYKEIEESGMYPEGEFSLELSSPGLDEPLKMLRQYKKNIGRIVEVLTNDAIKIEGKLLTVGEEEIELETETGKGKKKVIAQHTIPLSNIKTTQVQIRF